MKYFFTTAAVCKSRSDKRGTEREFRKDFWEKPVKTLPKVVGAKYLSLYGILHFVAEAGLEPATSSLWNLQANQLLYSAIIPQSVHLTDKRDKLKNVVRHLQRLFDTIIGTSRQEDSFFRLVINEGTPHYGNHIISDLSKTVWFTSANFGTHYATYLRNAKKSFKKVQKSLTTQPHQEVFKPKL